MTATGRRSSFHLSERPTDASQPATTGRSPGHAAVDDGGPVTAGLRHDLRGTHRCATDLVPARTGPGPGCRHRRRSSVDAGHARQPRPEPEPRPDAVTG